MTPILPSSPFYQAHTNKHTKYHRSGVGTTDQTVNATGFGRKPRRMSLVNGCSLTDEDQRRLQCALWYQSWGEGSSSDLAGSWKWPLTFWSYTYHTITSDLVWVNLNDSSSFNSKPNVIYLHVSPICSNRLFTEIKCSLYSACFTRHQTLLTQNVHLSSLSSQVRYVYITVFFSRLYMWHMLGSSEKLLKVGLLQFSSLWWQVTLYLWRMGCIYKEPKCTLQLPLTCMPHVEVWPLYVWHAELHETQVVPVAQTQIGTVFCLCSLKMTLYRSALYLQMHKVFVNVHTI